MPVVRRLLLAGVATALVVGGGVLVLDDDERPRAEEPTETSTPLAELDTTGLGVLRTGFCDRVPEAAVAEALGGEPESAEAHDNGDEIRLARGTRDLAHEYGCSWRAGEVTAAAWVFAPPVPRGTAADLVRSARRAKGCEPVPDAPAYGRPSVGLVCTSGPRREVSFRGLFGDAWLVCSLRSADVSAGETLDEAVDRAGRWCVATAQAAGSADAVG